MFRSLRNRLILSHSLPALLVIPLMGVAMLYVLESRLLLPMIYQDLAKEATLMAQITRNQPIFWQNELAAQSLVDGVTPYLNGRVTFLTLDGHVVASSDQSSGIGTPRVELPDLSTVDQGQVVGLQSGGLAEAFTPVYDLRGREIGVVRMSTRVVTVSDQIYQLRYLLGAVLLIGTLAGIWLGSSLALTLSQPIQRVTHSIYLLAEGDRRTHVEESGPDEIRLLAGAVNVLVDRLNSLESARRQLLANLVHELGRPLGAIRSAIQALLKGADQDPQLAHDLLTGLDSETARLRRLLDDLAGLHDQVLGQLELNRQPVALDAWLAGALAPWEAAAREKGLAWQVELPWSPDQRSSDQRSADELAEAPTIQIDPDRLAQALGNLLSNAVKFTPAGGQVTVTVRVDGGPGSAGGQLAIQVSDSGPGVPPDEQEKIFQPFYRGAHGRRIIQGMGLGLSIACDIVEAHGGRIELDSQPGGGSRFTINLPSLPLSTER